MKPSFKPSVKPIAVPFRGDRQAQVFVGVRTICSYMHIGPSTFYTWTRGYGFPATRTPEGRWMTCTALIDRWIKDRMEKQREQDIVQEGRATHD